MKSREELLKSPGYWFQNAQLELFTKVSEFIKKEGINRTELAKRLNVSKGYVTQILNGDFNFTLKKLIEISLSIGMIPKIDFVDLKQELQEDKIKRDTIGSTAVSSQININTPTTLKIAYTKSSEQAAA